MWSWGSGFSRLRFQTESVARLYLLPTLPLHSPGRRRQDPKGLRAVALLNNLLGVGTVASRCSKPPGALAFAHHAPDDGRLCQGGLGQQKLADEVVRPQHHRRALHGSPAPSGARPESPNPKANKMASHRRALNPTLLKEYSTITEAPFFAPKSSLQNSFLGLRSLGLRISCFGALVG